MNDEVHAARWVRKLDSFRVNAMESPDHGPIALVAPRGLRVLSRPERVMLAMPTVFSHAVPVLQTYTEIEPRLIDAVVESTEASAVVLEGTGLGNTPASAMDAISTLIDRGLPVVVATRTPSGGTGAVYGGAGGGATLRDLGVVGAASLTAAKARLLLMILLAQGLPASEVSAQFAAIAEQLR
jgi:L-asparaginase